jgi:hypothetical protein
VQGQVAGDVLSEQAGDVEYGALVFELLADKAQVYFD